MPVWLRITRVGNVFTGEHSANGTTWTKLTGTGGTASSTTINMPTSVYVGMVVCSNMADNLAVADFSQIKTTGNVTGQWQAADIGVAQPANIPDQLYVVVQDSAFLVNSAVAGGAICAYSDGAVKVMLCMVVAGPGRPGLTYL